MPKTIAKTHTDRLFPFAFYDELSENMPSYMFLNPAFSLKEELSMTKEQREQLFKQSQKEDVMNLFHQHNILHVEPFGELLTLELCCPAEDKETFLKKQKERDQLPISLLVVQLYDSSGLPVFAEDVTEASIQQIPEVLYDDPNLLIGVVSITQEEPRVAVMRLPEQMEAKIVEDVKNTEERTD